MKKMSLLEIFGSEMSEADSEERSHNKRVGKAAPRRELYNPHTDMVGFLKSNTRGIRGQLQQRYGQHFSGVMDALVAAWKGLQQAEREHFGPQSFIEFFIEQRMDLKDAQDYVREYPESEDARRTLEYMRNLYQ